MISYIKGMVLRKADNYLVVENQGLGYQIFVSKALLARLKTNTALELHLYHHYTENQNLLYGFENTEDLFLFEKLISVSGIGPKTALSFFAVAKTDELIKAIAEQNLAFLQSLPGIGKKTAERLALELKNKIAYLAGRSAAENSMAREIDGEALEALTTLGYSEKQALLALSKTDQELGLTDKVKQALKFLST